MESANKYAAYCGGDQRLFIDLEVNWGKGYLMYGSMGEYVEEKVNLDLVFGTDKRNSK